MENGDVRILELDLEIEDVIMGAKFTIEDVMSHMNIPYGYARTLFNRLFNLPQDLELLGKTLVVGKYSDESNKFQSLELIKVSHGSEEYLTKAQALEYIAKASKHVINLDTWVK